MELAPPSYEAATVKDIWQLVAPYLSSGQLCSASLVSQRWHSIFTAQLWGKPTSHFGLEYNGVLDHLARFQKTLDFARLHVRSYTYCLHLTPNEAVYFDDRPADWLKRLLERLPNLQSLVVFGVPYFDHPACQALSPASNVISVVEKGRASSAGQSSRSLPRNLLTMNDMAHGLRLLNASRCDNLTSIGLANALQRFTSLLYLDLSYTRSAHNPVVFAAFCNLYSLKILKLSNTGLRNGDMHGLGESIGFRVACLDIRDNEITHTGLNVLYDLCFFDDVDAADVESMQSPDFAASVYSAFTTGSVNRLTVDDAPATGIVQLGISGNQMTNLVLSKLMLRQSMRVLDVGRLESVSNGALLMGKGSTIMLTYLRVGCSVILPIANHDDDLRDDNSSIRGGTSYLQPAMLPHLQTLVLTDVPTRSTTDRLASALVTFVEGCAHESYKAMSQAKAELYTAPPGRQGQAAILQQAARRIFALETIVLETGSPHAQTAVWNSDATWSAGNTDFSFFRDDDQESAQPDRLSGQHHPSTFNRPLIDNLALLAAFRSNRKAVHQQRSSVAEHQHVIETKGYWPGTIRIERQTWNQQRAT